MTDTPTRLAASSDVEGRRCPYCHLAFAVVDHPCLTKALDTITTLEAKVLELETLLQLHEPVRKRPWRMEIRLDAMSRLGLAEGLRYLLCRFEVEQINGFASGGASWSGGYQTVRPKEQEPTGGSDDALRR